MDTTAQTNPALSGLVDNITDHPASLRDHLESNSGPVPTEAAASAGKKAKKKKDKAEKQTVRQAGQPAAIGTTKGVETMFRNAFRSEMDLLSLATSKVNIMISLNGFIVSALMVSHTFILDSSPEFIVPAGIFMLTAATSIIFALLSASPDHTGKVRELTLWIQDMFRRKAKFGDLKERLSHPSVHYFGDTPNVLIYEDRIKLSKEQYWEMMQDIIKDREQVYGKMSDELYWLGLKTNKQFKYLNFSYTAFRWGLITTLLTFAFMMLFLSDSPSVLPAGKNTGKQNANGISAFNHIYEPSAAQQLPDGRILVAEDESNRAFRLLDPLPNGTLAENQPATDELAGSMQVELNDLESLAADRQGNLYAATSYSTNEAGKRHPSREHLVRFKIDGNRIQNLLEAPNIKDALLNAQDIRQAILEKTGQNADFQKLNIEGMTYDTKHNRLLLGIREPLAGGKSIIIVILNPNEMFEHQAQPQFAPPILLDLGGTGIRSLDYYAAADTYIVADSARDARDHAYPRLWRWDGQPQSTPQLLNVPALTELKNAEASGIINFQGKPYLVVMSDEGNKKKQQPARYLTVDFAKLTPH